jgi:hypothetical protein
MPRFSRLFLIPMELTINEFVAVEGRPPGRERHLAAAIRARSSMERYQRGSRVVKHRSILYKV